MSGKSVEAGARSTWPPASKPERAGTGRGTWAIGWLSWWRRPPRANAVDELDGHMMRDIGLPRDGVSARVADELLSRARDEDPWLL